MKNNLLVTNRKCIVTNKIIPKSALIRVVKQKNGKILIDSNVKGRGAYISKNCPNFAIIKQRKMLNRVFKTNVDQSVYEDLIALLKGVQDGEKRQS